MSCRCEPHASSTNRCAFCKAEDYAERSRADVQRQLDSAVALIQRVAVGDIDPGYCPDNVKLGADQWLREQGFESGEVLLARRKRAARMAQIDDEIAALRAEKAKL